MSEDVKQLFESSGQPNVFRFYDELNSSQQETLTDQAKAIDLDEIKLLTNTLIKSTGDGNSAIAEELEPADFLPLPEHGGDTELWQKARTIGENALKAGRVAAFTVAGGQGTRLGYDGPKGTFGVSPVTQRSLFQIFAEKIGCSVATYGQPVPWFIMTSVINHEATVTFFEENNYFGLDPETVHFFSQGLMPAVDADGRIFLADKGEIALSPDGHGGSLRALVRSGAVDKMKAAGVDTISYFQVDNPLVRCIDPEFIGFHLMNESELSSKALPKAYAEEKVGVFCQHNGQAVVIEYSDMPERLASERDASGELRFRGGSIAIHIFDRDFVERIGSGADPDAALPFHLAHKKIAYVSESGDLITPAEPNGYKFEMFVFDALPFARNPVIIETGRADDFSPVKNAEGTDSPQTSADDQRRQFARWLTAANVEIETDETGLPSINFEISPLFADTEERFVTAWNQLTEKPIVTEGTVIA